ncbi:MAG: hypothetical protein KGL39_58645 [Patescibacteria group bacterium]|nr:hypothetical protein [Patescibacteria group bacterium]
MYNYSATLIALLVKMKLLTEEGGEYLNGELQSKIHTARFKEAQQIVQDLIDEMEDKDKVFLVEPWMPYIRRMERKIEQLEKELTKSRVATADSKPKIVLTPKK